MLIVRRCLVSLVLVSTACASSAASLPINAELEECTELVRGLMMESIVVSAREEICSKRVAKAEERASVNEWLARWGLPIGGIGGATLAAVVTGLIFNFARR